MFMRFFGQDRESGTIIPKQARYQTAPRPEIFWVVLIFSCETDGFWKIPSIVDYMWSFVPFLCLSFLSECPKAR